MEKFLDDLVASLGSPHRTLLVPPDITRLSSGVGPLTVGLYERLPGDVQVLPATGTHHAMAGAEIERMYPGIPPDRFHAHDFRNRVRQVATIPASFVQEMSEGRMSAPIAVEVAEMLLQDWDCIVSIGQLVPHEVAGIANHAKNIYIGAGGSDMIHKSHYLGAVYGMERVMGRADNPVRAVLQYAARAAGLRVHYLLKVSGSGKLFAGPDDACFYEAAAHVHIDLLERAPRRVVVSLDPQEYRSTWLGNKAIYRTRMAIADGGELIVLAPGVRCFGEDPTIDALIRRYGYRDSATVQRQVAENADLRANLSAAAHLIHGSSEGRFRITYCPGHLSRSEIEAVGYDWGDLAQMQARWGHLREGWNEEDTYFIAHPGQSLWSVAGR